MTVRRLDLADLESVRAFAAGWSGNLDVLVNNAGIMMVPAGDHDRRLRAAVRHQPPRPLRADQPAAAARHRPRRHALVGPAPDGAIDLDDLNWQRRPYSATGAYAQSKLANLLFTLELQRRLRAAGSRVRALAAHPGWAATNLQGRTGSWFADRAMLLGNRLFAQSDEGGALPTLAAATRDLPGGSYLGPDGFQELRGNPTLVGRTAAAGDPDLARRLWEESARLTGVDFPRRRLTRGNYCSRAVFTSTSRPR